RRRPRQARLWRDHTIAAPAAGLALCRLRLGRRDLRAHRALLRPARRPRHRGASPMTGNVWLGIMAFPALFVLIALRVPIGIARLRIGAGGSALVYGSVTPVLAQFKSLAYESVGIYTLSVVPLFLLMGQFATMGGLSRALFSAADAAVGHRRGGVALATIAGCAGFGAICGSSLATAAAIGRVALPELKAAGYSSAFASGALAAGGTLGILIPPSIILVIFAALTEQNVADLFLAALVPGLI